MNQQGTLSQQVEAYHNWKKELIRQIGRYRLWLQDNNLFSDDVSTRIRHGLELLVEDELTIAFVGAVVLMWLSDTLTVVNLLAPMVVYMFGFGLCVPPSMGAALEPFPRVAGSASAMMGFSQMTSAGIASLAVLPLYDSTAAPLGIATLSLSVLAASVFLVLVPASLWVTARSEG